MSTKFKAWMSIFMAGSTWPYFMLSFKTVPDDVITPVILFITTGVFAIFGLKNLHKLKE